MDRHWPGDFPGYRQTTLLPVTRMQGRVLVLITP